MGYSISEIILDLDNEYDIYCNDLYIKCFEWNHEKKDKYVLENSKSIDSEDFIIKSGVAIKYIGKSKIVNVPEGIRELSPCLFWDNQIITEVILPESLISISGDTFT